MTGEQLMATWLTRREMLGAGEQLRVNGIWQDAGVGACALFISVRRDELLQPVSLRLNSPEVHHRSPLSVAVTSTTSAAKFWKSVMSQRGLVAGSAAWRQRRRSSGQPVFSQAVEVFFMGDH